MYSKIISFIFIVNGIYDILCAISILWLNNYLSNIHLNIFKNKKISKNLVIRRLLSYWIFTYGIVRLFAGFYYNFILNILASLTYFIEAFCFKYENYISNNMISYKVNFVSIFSIILGIFTIIKSFI